MSLFTRRTKLLLTGLVSTAVVAATALVTIPAAASPSTPLATQTAGAYLDAPTGRLVVHVTSAAAARAVQQTTHATTRIVGHSLAQLNAVKAALDRTAAPPGLSWGVDVRTDSVTVSVPRGAHGPKLQSFLHTARSYDAVRTVSVATAPRPAALSPGDAILTGGARCSAAYAGVKGSTEYVVTAGHCTNIGSQWTTSSGQLIGTTAASHFPGQDWGVIQVANPQQLGANNGAVTQLGEPPVGTQVCKLGSTTGLTCGQIIAYDQTVTYAEGTVSGLILTNVCVQPGDSGGQLSAGSTGVGIVSGGTIGSCGAGFQSFFFPAQDAFGGFGLQLEGGSQQPPPPNGTWAPFHAYQAGDVVTYNGQTYRCLQAHTSLPGWEPPNAPALWQPV